MKALTLRNYAMALVLALVPVLGGCDQERANSAPANEGVADVSTTQTTADAFADTNGLPPTNADQDLANAPGKVISTPDTAPPGTNSNPQLTDFVKLVQAGVGESVLTAYVTNSPSAFNLTADDIVYLNDLGTPQTVINAMLQRDQYFNGSSASMQTTAQSQATYSNPAPGGPPPAGDQSTMAPAAQATAEVPPLTPPPAVVEDAQQAPNTSYSYFYDSLAPYGSWIDVSGYGPCWQPTVVVANPGWSPYCNSGHWVYSDCGWYWASDYSWGWAPFHYGRWFHHARWGWCWAPDTVWGPAWVSWRYSDAYCGWAPLPPAACYRPGFGFSYWGHPVGFSFTFGLGVDSFVFVPVGHLCDHNVFINRMPHREVTKIYNTTIVNSQIIHGNRNTIINRGVPVDRVAAASHMDIRPIKIKAEADGPRGARLARDGSSLSVYRPTLPTPRPGEAPKRVGEGIRPAQNFDLRSRVDQQQAVRNPVATPAAVPERRPIIANPAMRAQENANRWQPNTERPGSIATGPERGNPTANQNSLPNTPTAVRHGPEFPPGRPTQQITPANNDNRRTATPSMQPAAPAQNVAPTFNRPNNGAEQQRQLLQRQQQQQQFEQRQLQEQQKQLQQQQRQYQQPTPRQEVQPRPYEAPRANPWGNNNQSYNPGYRAEQPQIRQEPVAPPRAMEQRPAPETRYSAPQNSAPARESHVDSSPSRGGGGGGGGWGGNQNNNNNGNGNNNNGGGWGGGGRNR